MSELVIPDLPIIPTTDILSSEMNARMAAIAGWANGNIGSDNLLNNSILASAIAAGAITESKYADQSVPERAIKDGAVTSRKLKPSFGYKPASGASPVLSTGGTETDIPGIAQVISSPVPAWAIVFGRFAFQIQAPTGSGGVSVQALGKLMVNGAQWGSTTGAKYQVTTDSPGGFTPNFNTGDVGIWPVLMAAGVNYTLGLRLRHESGFGQVLCWGDTYLFYIILAA